MLRVFFFLISAALLGVVGCGGKSAFDIVPVSGVVTMDDEPLAGATVTFLPKASQDSNAGPASVGETDAFGKFTLTTAGGKHGAAVASHQVMITTVKNKGTSTADDNVYADAEPEKVPKRYNSATTLTFEVPAAGSKEANFRLTSNPEG